MNRFAYARLLILVGCALCFPAATQAVELNTTVPGPRLAADPQIAALEQALTNAARRMAEAPKVAPPPPVSHTGLTLSIVLLLAAAFRLAWVARAAIRRLNLWLEAPAKELDHTARVLAGEPSMAEFFRQLREGLYGAQTPAPTQEAGLPNPVPGPSIEAPGSLALDPLQERFTLAGKHLVSLRTRFTELGRARDDADRLRILHTILEQVELVKESVLLPDMRPLWLMALALQGLVKQLSSKASDITASALRTAAAALDVLGALCVRSLKPNLATEPPVRLLAVDDDPISRRAMSFALAKAFRESDLAPAGEAALALAAKQPYDVIFLDVEMPGMDGFELCSRIHETELNRMTPVVFVTGHSDFESRAQATLLGAQDLIAKPFLAFEITVKALTLVMRARLDQSAAAPATAKNSEAALTTPAALESPAAAVSRDVAQPGQLCETAGRDQTLQSGPVTGNPGGGVAPVSAPPPSAFASVQAAASPELSPGELSAPSHPSRQQLANAFFTHAPDQIKELRKYLASARDAQPNGLNEPLSDLYLSTHELRAKAGRAELSAALRLASALEAMVKKLFQHPKLCATSTFAAAAGALDVLDELCRARKDSDLAQRAFRLMVVDDDPIARRAIAMPLQLVFGRPDSADSGEAGLALAGKREFDLIFLDVRMPGMDGFAACSQIHATVLNRLTPVVFVTSHSDTASQAQAAVSGGCGFIPKPVLASQITLIALSYILRSRLGRQNPILQAPPSLTGNGPEPASPESAGHEHPAVSSAVGIAN
ncbi:MAG: response regulator [Limisphaerales bacterium]